MYGNIINDEAPKVAIPRVDNIVELVVEIE